MVTPSRLAGGSVGMMGAVAQTVRCTSCLFNMDNTVQGPRRTRHTIPTCESNTLVPDFTAVVATHASITYSGRRRAG